jgi:TM2 domain-containing membrane protein YozV
MSKSYLRSKLKSTGTGYLCWFFGMHYAYLGKWGLLVLYWVTLGGIFIWVFIDMFRISGLVQDYNLEIFEAIENIEKKEKEEEHFRQMSILSAINTYRASNQQGKIDE